MCSSTSLGSATRWPTRSRARTLPLLLHSLPNLRDPSPRRRRFETVHTGTRDWIRSDAATGLLDSLGGRPSGRMDDPLAVTRDRLDAARQAWSDAYHERGRALILELARSEDSLIGMTMGPVTGGEERGLPAPAPRVPSMAPERPGLPSTAPERRGGPPPLAPERRVHRSRSRHHKKGPKNKDARAQRRRSPADPQARRRRSLEAPPPRRRASPSTRAQRALWLAPDASQSSGDCTGQAPGLFAKSASSARASTSPPPPLRRAPPELQAAWRRAMIQRPPGDFGAEPPRLPPAA